MKKRIILFAAFFCYFLGYSQMVVKLHDGTEVHNGDVFTFNTVDEESATLKFRVHNNSTDYISVKIECTSLENTDGEPFQFCYGGTCLYAVVEGRTLPMEPGGFPIAPGSHSGDGDHFWNLRTESTTGVFPMNYNFKFFMVDPLGNEYGDPINVTYRYAGALAVNDVNQQNIATIKNTVVKDVLHLESKINTTLQIVEISGKVVHTSKLIKGDNSVNLQNLTSGMYIVNIANAAGKMISNKIIKK